MQWDKEKELQKRNTVWHFGGFSDGGSTYLVAYSSQ